MESLMPLSPQWVNVIRRRRMEREQRDISINQRQEVPIPLHISDVALFTSRHSHSFLSISNRKRKPRDLHFGDTRLHLQRHSFDVISRTNLSADPFYDDGIHFFPPDFFLFVRKLSLAINNTRCQTSDLFQTIALQLSLNGPITSTISS